MLLTITTTYQPATDLGYLLHKLPSRTQSFSLSFGQAHVFYPEASIERCTAALLLDVDPVQLSRGQHGSSGGGATPLEPYVNDRPYVASSFLSVALSEVFGTALNGHCKSRQELAETAIPLQAKLSVLPCRGGEGFLKRLFEPLGYSVTAEPHLLDEKYPEWGKSSNYTVTLAATCRLSDLLTHLYVLVPVLDDDKHYWIGKDEIEKLLRRGKGWLETHPEQEQIAFRYLKHSRSLTRAAIARLIIEESPDEDALEESADKEEEKLEQPVSLHQQRLGAVREFALYGETTGETDEFGLPIRYNWAAEYAGKAMVVYGHTPVPEAEWLNRTINIDTGCVFGGKLTALRYPEKELVSVPALRTYWESAKPFLAIAGQAPTLTAQQQHDDILDIKDVSGKRLITTRLHQNIIIREENTIAALEVMSRFAANPKWLIYLPPTMSPSETSKEPGLLEHPAEAFAYFRNQGVPTVVCEEKHMGSRAVVIVCRDEEAARKTFGVTGEGSGICYTRTGRRFFDDTTLEAEMLARVRAALTVTNFWEKFHTDWACLDCELMPWSVKAQALLLHQYAAVGAASHAALDEAVSVLEQATARGIDVAPLLEQHRLRSKLAVQYIAAYNHYCWPVHSVFDLKLAPFHILATQGEVHANKDHVWHMDTLAEVCNADKEMLLATPYKVVDVTDAASIEAAIQWWQELTGRGGEGMVVKPLDFIVRGKHGIVQPALKCRGPEYLRIIYGPEYSIPANLERLRSRSVGAKRSLAMREFALGIEALERFARHEPLRAVHERVFGVLALESEPVDPRL